jgi:hypothetical protein
MQKFLSLGAECVRIQECTDASQGISIVIFGFLLLYPSAATAGPSGDGAGPSGD